MKNLLLLLWRQLSAWLLRHALLVLATCLLVLALVVVFSGKKSQDAKDAAQQAVAGGTLAKKQVRKVVQELSQKADSIHQQAVLLKQVVKARDSLVVKARTQDARADSLLKHVKNESSTDPALTPARVASLLVDYQPKAWPVGKDSVR